MSEVPGPPNGHININISDTGVSYETSFSLPEVFLWVDVFKDMLLSLLRNGPQEQEINPDAAE